MWGMVGRIRYGAMGIVLPGEYWVRGESHHLHLSVPLDHSDGEVSMCLDYSSRRRVRSVGTVEVSDVPSEDRRMDLSATLGFFVNNAKKSFAIFQAAEISGMRDEEAGLLVEPLETCGSNLLGRLGMGDKVISGEGSECVQALGRRAKNRAQR
jgi:hypothetical protein